VKNYKVIIAFFLLCSTPLFAQPHLMQVKSWAYQLQDIDISQISANPTFEMIVMDYSADGSDEGKFTPENIAQIKDSGKLAIAYISIGEAEDYRWYWDADWDADHNGSPDMNAPPWLGPENPDWEGNYEVRFWYPEWQDIVLTYVDTIVAQGFDGIYMDIIDGYYYWSELNPEQPYADSLMIQFVLNIRSHIAELTDETFFLIPQNGEFIIEEAHVSEHLKTAYLKAIDGIGVEDVFFFGDSDNNNPYNPDYERIDMLEKYLQYGVNVFSVEYLTAVDLMQQYMRAIEQHRFIPYVTTRDLDVLNNGIISWIEKNAG